MDRIASLHLTPREGEEFLSVDELGVTYLNWALCERRYRRGLLWLEEFYNDLEVAYQEKRIYKGIPRIVRARKEEVVDIGGSPELRSRKRELSPTTGETQLGSLHKHSTAMKNSQSLRRKFNQTYFVGTPTTGLPLSTHDGTQGTPERKRKRKYIKRKLTAENRQLLITSVFSPKPRMNQEVLQKEVQKEEEKEVPLSMPEMN